MKKNKIRVERDTLIPYLALGLLIILFGLLLNADFAWVFLGAYLLIPILAIIQLHVLAGNIRYVVDFDGNELINGEKGFFTLTVFNESAIPVPYFQLTFADDYHIQIRGGSSRCFSVGGHSQIAIRCNFQTRAWGRAMLRVRSMYRTDIFGLCSAEEISTQEGKKIEILPQIPQIESSAPFFFWNYTLEQEEKEQELTAPFAYKETEPGYEFREYQQGDPLKKINWKLSERLDMYMVRKDCQICDKGALIWMNPYALSKNAAGKNAVFETQALVEGCLGIVDKILSRGIPCKVCYKTKEMWTETEVDNSSEIGILQKELIHFQCSQTKQMPNVPLEGLTGNEKYSNQIVLTAQLTEQLSMQIQNTGVQTQVIALQNTKGKVDANLLILKNGYELSEPSEDAKVV